MIRVYGFLVVPFLLPVFLTLTVFSLKLIKQRISDDIEHFTAHKKDSSIKYPINVISFIPFRTNSTIGNVVFFSIIKDITLI